MTNSDCDCVIFVCSYVYPEDKMLLTIGFVSFHSRSIVLQHFKWIPQSRPGPMCSEPPISPISKKQRTAHFYLYRSYQSVDNYVH